MAKIKILRVVAKKDGFRRAGFAFGSDPQDIPLDTLDAKQLAALKGDRMLVATELEIDQAEAGEPAAGAGTEGSKPARRGTPAAK